jgi:hypothetical protein
VPWTEAIDQEETMEAADFQLAALDEDGLAVEDAGVLAAFRAFVEVWDAYVNPSNDAVDRLLHGKSTADARAALEPYMGGGE